MPSIYLEGIRQEYLARLASHLAGAFRNNYIAGRPTVFLLPGGVGSQLMRADRRSDQGPPFAYSVAWAHCGIIFEESEDLRLTSKGDGADQYYEDSDGRYVVPEGGVDTSFILAAFRPYRGFIQWCRDNQINLLVLGWDWRRGIEHSANFFLDSFLPMFEAQLADLDPLTNFTIIGHSAGGMVVKEILNRADDNDYVRRMRRAITVGAPFYGYANQTLNYIEGNFLNFFMPGGNSGEEGPKALISLMCSMPGSYEFLYLDKATYDARQGDFAADPDGYNLLSYPSTDRDTGEVVDPFDPEGLQPDVHGCYRYPMDYGFSGDLLAQAKVVSRKVAAELPESVAGKLFCIRGVQNQNKTPIRLTCRRVPQNYAPYPTRSDADRPVAVFSGPGDGVQAAWGARLLGLPDPGQVITIRGDEQEIDHEVLMNSRRVQREIGRLLNLEEVHYGEGDPVVPATREDLNHFLQGVDANVNDRPRTREERRQALEQFLEGQRPKLPALLRRAYRDFQKG